MFGITLLGLAMLAVLSAGSYSMMLIVSSTTSLISAQTELQNQQRIEMSINHALRPYGENRALVAPIDLSSTVEYNGEVYLTIPSRLGLSKLNAWKMPYIYCPISGDSSEINTPLSSQEINYGNNTYSVVTFNDNVDNNLDYVIQSNLNVSSDLLDKKTLAIVISPRLDSDIPSCSDVYIKENGKYGFTKKEGKSFSGIVTVVSRDESSNYTGIPNYNVDLGDFSPETTFEGLTSSWDAMKPLRYTIDLNDGNNRTVSGNILFENNSPSLDKSLILRNTGSEPILISANNKSKIEFKNMVIDLSNITFSSNIELVFKSSKVKIDNILFSGKVSAIDSDVEIVSDSEILGSDDTGLFISENSKVKQNNANLTVSNSADSEAISLSGSNWTSTGSTLSVSSASGSSKDVLSVEDNSSVDMKNNSTLILKSSSNSANSILSIDASSSVSIRNSTISAPTTTSELIDLSGEMMINNSILNTSGAVSTGFNIISGRLNFTSSNINLGGTMQLGFNLQNGAILTLQDAQIGSTSKSATVGVLDTSASSVYGTNTIIYANTCLSGYLFENIKQPGYSSPMDGSTQESANRSVWTCK